MFKRKPKLHATYEELSPKKIRVICGETRLVVELPALHCVFIDAALFNAIEIEKLRLYGRTER